MKNRLKLSDNLWGYWLAKHLKLQASKMSIDDFSAWYVKTFILQNGNRETGKTIPSLLKCKNDISIIYKKLLTTQIEKA